MSTTANQIEAYQGDSAMAGGYGASGTQIVNDAIWKFVDYTSRAFDSLNARNFQRQQTEYQQKIKDRDEVAQKISSKELNTNQMDDDSRLKFDGEIKSLQDKFIEAARKNTLTDSEEYIKLNKEYSDIENRINVAKTNYLIRQKEIQANAEMYDPNSSIKTTSKQYLGQDGKSTVTEQTSSKELNPRRLSYNQQAFQKHDEEQRKLIAADPNHLYEPFVPLSKYKQENVLFGPVMETSEKAVGKYQKETISNPSFEKTVQKTLENWAENRQDMELYVKDLLSTSESNENGLIGSSIIHGTNMILDQYNQNKPDGQKVPLISNSDNIPSIVAKINFAKGGDILNQPQRKIEFNSKLDEELYQKQAESNIQLQKEKDIEKYRTDQNIRQFNLTQKQAKNDKELSPMVELYKEQYKTRMNQIVSGPGNDSDKKPALKALDIEFKEKLFASAEAKGATPNNLPHYNKNKEGKVTSSALGSFGILEDSGHAKEAFLKDPDFESERKEYKSYKDYYNALKNSNDLFRTSFTPKYLNFLQKRAGTDVNQQLVFNYGGKASLMAYRRGDLNYIPKNNTATLREYLMNAYNVVNNYNDSSDVKTTDQNLSKWEKNKIQ